jgi:hypothetical protein
MDSLTTGIKMSDEFWKQFFTFLGLAITALTSYLSMRAARTNTKIGQVTVTKLDQAAVTVEEAKVRVEQVHEIANGRLTAAQEEMKILQAENDRLKAELGQRRSTDA